MSKFAAGLDPGSHGAIVLHNESEIIVYDMPTLEIMRNGKKRTQIDLYELARFIDTHAANISHAYIENPQSMPNQASNATYRLGLNCGIAQMAIASAFIPMTLIAPATWKKAMGLSKDKGSSRLKASQIAPQWSEHWSRVKDADRAEAFLISIYGMTKM